MDLWKKLLLLVLGCILLMFCCALIEVFSTEIPKTQKLELSNFANEFKLVGNDLNQSNHIHSLDLNISGKITAEAIITLNNPDSTALRTFQITKDSVFINYSGDWYYDSFILDYKSDSSSSGTLYLEYTFYD